MNKFGFSWKRLAGITNLKNKVSRSTGIPLTKTGRQRKIGKVVTGGGCLIPLVFIACLILVLVASVRTQILTVQTDTAELKGRAAFEGKVVATITKGQFVDLIKEIGSWYLVQSPDYVGWMHKSNFDSQGKALDSTNGVDSSIVTTNTPGPRVVTKTPKKVEPESRTEVRTYFRGPRGGCYYYTPGGTKIYVSRSLCG